MGLITANVRLGRNQPLQRVFVEHIGMARDTIAVKLTDENGSFTFDGGLFDSVAVRILCQNSVIRVIDGDRLNIAVSFEANVRNGETLTVTPQLTSQSDHYRLLESCRAVYDKVWRQFRPYSLNNREAFPLGRARSTKTTLARSARLELSYPDRSPIPMAWVEPAGATNGRFPVVHFKHRSEDSRLFGDWETRDHRSDPYLVPHELGHVFHFATLQEATRIRVEAEYSAYILLHLDNPYHDVAMVTSPMVAFIEALGMFADRFYFFATRVRSELSGRELSRAFIIDELAEERVLPTVLRDTYQQVGVLRGGTFESGGTIDTAVPKRRDVEGAVYGAIYLELARRVGLHETVGLVLGSDATTFDAFVAYVHGRGNNELTSAIDAVERRWM